MQNTGKFVYQSSGDKFMQLGLFKTSYLFKVKKDDLLIMLGKLFVSILFNRTLDKGIFLINSREPTF